MSFASLSSLLVFVFVFVSLLARDSVCTSAEAQVWCDGLEVVITGCMHVLAAAWPLNSINLMWRPHTACHFFLPAAWTTMTDKN